MCLCVYKCSITSFPGIFPHTAIDQAQQHPDWMIPGWVTGSMRAHGCTFGPRTKTTMRNKDSLALFLPGQGIDRNGKMNVQDVSKANDVDDVVLLRCVVAR